MSTASATAGAAPKKGMKKLIVLLLAVLVPLLGIGGGALFWMKQKSQSEHADEGEARAPVKTSAHRDPKSVPAFVPLEAFTVNLADRESERYAQVGITFELTDAKDADRIKNFMPVIRSNILLLLAHKTSNDLLQREGKIKLAREVQREAARALGFEVDDDDDEDVAPPAAGDKPKKKRKRAAAPPGPVHAVHFSNFIIQ